LDVLGINYRYKWIALLFAYLVIVVVVGINSWRNKKSAQTDTVKTHAFEAVKAAIALASVYSAISIASVFLLTNPPAVDELSGDE
jgi:hypothetical protein